MNSKFSVLALICLLPLLSALTIKDAKKRSLTEKLNDPEVAETGFGAPAAVHGGSKYFQYAHVPAKDHYEHGHKRGNDHHFIERHEKAHPHAGEFKTKVRWGDKHGGYGEHYWDYNHAGHDGEGSESQQNGEYQTYEETKQNPIYSNVDEQLTSSLGVRGKRQPSPARDVEFINENAKSLILNGATGRHGGNYKSIDDFERGKRDNSKINGENLVFEPISGFVIDQKSGITYQLKPVDY